MDDSCAVCAEPLEWVAYGCCGHREVCSTCVVRLRFVLQDPRCCICKTESPTVFVTKALGDYTRVITDFSAFPSGANVGQVGSYWYHEGSQAFFDDVDHYRMINAMCRLSCSICDSSAGEQGSGGAKKKCRFRNVEQLKGHLFQQHMLFMCSLCLEGRKVFICEQKLYTRFQLNQHVRTGDLEVDGSESESGGFTGHPMCEFCRNPFYGDNELYMHMSTEHYTCHICQRRHPGKYDYFKNYDDLETHFRQVHFLCEDGACMEKKFIVFQTEAEMKRHNAIEHGGHTSRSERKAALQIPISFTYRRSNDQDQRRGTGHGFRHDPCNLYLSIESFGVCLGETSQTGRVTDPIESFIANSASASNVPPSSSRSEHILEETFLSPLSGRDLPESSSKHALDLNHGNAAILGEELFPPLPSKKKSRKPKRRVEGLGNNTLASSVNRKKGSVKVLNTPWPSPVEVHKADPSNSASFTVLRSIQNQGPTASTSSSSLASHLAKAATSVRENGFVPSVSANSSCYLVSGSKTKHSSSAPNLDDASKQPMVNPVSTAVGKQVVEEAHTANESLVERIHIGLGKDEERYAAFKCISAEYHQGQINTLEYVSYVEQFGLMHIMLELARLCPDPRKRKELIDAYNAIFLNDALQKNNDTDAGGLKERKRQEKKGKGEVVDNGDDADGKVELSDSFLNAVRKLQLNQKPQEEEEVEVLSKEGYRISKRIPNSTSASVNLAVSKSAKKHRKTSKFGRVRLGESMEAEVLDVGHASSCTDRMIKKPSNKPRTALPLQGVWKNNGAQKLFEK